MDHTPYFTLPPLLQRWECWLAHKGTLVDPQGRPDKDLPTQGHRVPGAMMQPKGRHVTVMTLVPVSTDMGYLRKDEAPGRWLTVKDLRDVSGDEIHAYLATRFPQDRCGRHDDGCKRCCEPHHRSMANKTKKAFRKWAEFLHFEERKYGKPVWGIEKLVDVYAVARPHKYDDPPPRMNPPGKVYRFQAWLVAQPDATAKELGWTLWLAQTFGLRYEEFTRAEYPPDDPDGVFFWDRDARSIRILGKGRQGGEHGKPFPLEETDEATLRKLLAWRARIGADLQQRGGVAPDPVLFPNLDDGRRKSDAPGGWNRTLQRHGKKFNSWCQGEGGEGHPEWALNVRLLTSHKVGRPVAATDLARKGVPAVVRQELLRMHPDTAQRYERFGDEEKREILRGARAATPAHEPTNGALLEELRALRRTVDELRGELREKDVLIAELARGKQVEVAP